MALADKLDTLTGFWAIDEKPTGSKDPFALRRTALGVIRLVLGNGVRTNLMQFLYEIGKIQFVEQYGEHIVVTSTIAKDLLFELILSGEHVPAFDGEDENSRFEAVSDWVESKLGSPVFNENNPNFVAEGEEERFDYDIAARDLLAFLHDRLKVYLRDQGIRHDIIDAVLSMPGNDDLVLLVNRATALNDVLKTEDGTNLLQGLKRAGNILAQAEDKDGVEYSFGADPKFAETDQERALFAALDKAEPAIREAVRLEDFQAATQGIATLRAPIDAFFEAVQINTDNQVLRRNRLNLLSRIREAGRLIADFGKIEG